MTPDGNGPTIAPKYQALFTPVVRWNGPVRWKYNHARAPLFFASDRAGVIAQLQRSFDKWTSSCGITHVYSGETTTAPSKGRIEPIYGVDPDGVSVVGWGTLDPGLDAWTYVWYWQGANTYEIFDADVTLSANRVNSVASLDRLMTHEWGHALGLDHSDVEAAIMAGPPATSYNSLVDLQPDDLRGCRCLYGLPPGMSAPYACSMPSVIDVGAAAIGQPSHAPPVTLTNSGNAPLAIDLATLEGTPFRDVGGCTAGTVVLPGASCTIDVEATPNELGASSGHMTLHTSDGAYEFTLMANGVAAIPPTPSVEVVEFYNATLDHYFITWGAAEIANLDAGLTPTRWTRTGLAFRAFPSAQAETSTVCRFYIPPAHGSSHFFGRGTVECNATAQAHPDFVLEAADYMHMALPAAGTCAAGTQPVYRVFDVRADANHRYSTDRAVRDLMVANGWLAEGDGPDRVVMCAPQSQ